MRDLAPDITRQRLLVEGLYATAVDADDVRRFMLDLPRALDLRSYGEVTVHAPGGQGKEDNEGFDADAAVSFTRERFAMTELEHQAF